MPKLTNEQYAELCARHAPKSRTAMDTLRAFICGGGVCVLGQLITYGWETAGAGALVPITGFANAVASPALEFRAEGMITGLAAKLFIIAGPVIVYGTLASVVYGLILCLAT